MRVVAGELRGRRLAAPAGREVRPTSDRVREALFSILGGVEGAVVLDLYCGTGALAIEALSRGAERATLTDTDVRGARRNVEALGLAERTRIVRGDALAFLRGTDERFDLILCDPPYRLAAGLGPELDQLLPARLRPGGRIVAESSAREPLELALEPLRERRYGDTLLRVYAP